jgi:hypothetical protein
MRASSALVLLALVPPLALASHSFEKVEGAFALACRGAQSEPLVSLPPVGEECKDEAFFPAQPAAGFYTATLSWTATHERYAQMHACFGTLRLVTQAAGHTLWTGVESQCVEGPSPLVLEIPASSRDGRLHLSVWTSTGESAAWFATRLPAQEIAYEIVHEP